MAFCNINLPANHEHEYYVPRAKIQNNNRKRTLYCAVNVPLCILAAFSSLMFLKEFAQNLLYVAGIYAHTSEEHTILHNRCYTNCKQVSKHSLNNLFLVLT